MESFEERRRKARMAEQPGDDTVMNDQQEDPKQKDPNYEPSKIIITPVEMDVTCKSKHITSMAMCKMINKVMRGVTPDYDGSRIRVEGNQVVCELFFCENPHATFDEKKQIKVVDRVDNMSNTRVRDLSMIIDRHNMRNNHSRIYQLTQSGKEALGEFVPNYMSNRNYNNGKTIVNWSQAAKEDSEMAMNGQNKIYLKVAFDLGKFLRKVYGNRSSAGSNLTYEVIMNKPLDAIKLANGNIIATKWQLIILQLDDKNIKEAYEESGLSPLQNTLGIVR